ncbi:hypothetical protein Tco_0235996 [Tanacetum coccineum]
MCDRWAHVALGYGDPLYGDSFAVRPLLYYSLVGVSILASLYIEMGCCGAPWVYGYNSNHAACPILLWSDSFQHEWEKLFDSESRSFSHRLNSSFPTCLGFWLAWLTHKELSAEDAPLTGAKRRSDLWIRNAVCTLALWEEYLSALRMHLLESLDIPRSHSGICLLDTLFRSSGKWCGSGGFRLLRCRRVL